jgi:hypothetical protein
MDLQQTWNKLKEEKLNTPTQKILPNFTKHSKHPVQKLLQSLLTTLSFAIIIGVFFVVLIFVFDHWLIKLLLILLSSGYLFFVVHNYRTYLTSKKKWSGAIETNLRTSLERIHHVVSSSIRFQEKAALLIYPISVTAGFLMGLFVGGDGVMDFEKDIRDTTVIIILIVAMVILTPSCYYLSHWMYKLSYGKYLDQLKILIDEMKQGD